MTLKSRRLRHVAAPAERRLGLRLRHVILMSDGLANVGEKNPKVLGHRAADAFRRGISVTTLGVGLDVAVIPPSG